MPIVVPTTYNEASKNTCPEKRTVTQTHAFTVKVRTRVCLECSLHPGARSANPWGKYGCKSGVPVLTPGARFSQILDPCPCSWGVFPGILVSGPCSWGVFPGQVCVGGHCRGVVGNYSPKFCFRGIVQKLFKISPQAQNYSKTYSKTYSKIIHLISTLSGITRRDGGAPASS